MKSNLAILSSDQKSIDFIKKNKLSSKLNLYANSSRNIEVALKFAKTSNRYEAGCIEVQMKNHISDRTAWQRMLKNDIDESVDLYKLKEELVGVISSDLKSFILENVKIEYINYPSISFPEKIKSLNL